MPSYIIHSVVADIELNVRTIVPGPLIMLLACMCVHQQLGQSKSACQSQRSTQNAKRFARFPGPQSTVIGCLQRIVEANLRQGILHAERSAIPAWRDE
ncbi:hypothetical protein NB99_19130 [Xanthomonas citri pv. fuscans]|nr:hypothetical protein NB99_19130 [Xanthomonas citri pv. fuscans]KGU43516.1 hypothetical protein NY94_11545 [Xanthomonas phaseoli pv. phaseoli]